MSLIINIYLSKSDRNLVRYLDCHAVRRRLLRILISALSALEPYICLKALASGPMVLATKLEGLVLALITSLTENLQCEVQQTYLPPELVFISSKWDYLWRNNGQQTISAFWRQ